MSDEAVIVVPLPDGRALALELSAYQAALERGRELVPPQGGEAGQAQGPDEVLDAHGMEQRTGVPSSWWLEAARRGDVPCVRAGKYVRFRASAALAALEKRR